MYTQSPEYQIAFRMAARGTHQTNDNLLCDSFGHAFKALEFMSEDIPEHASPSIDDTADNPADHPAETSQRILEPLKELAGPDRTTYALKVSVQSSECWIMRRKVACRRRNLA